MHDRAITFTSISPLALHAIVALMRPMFLATEIYAYLLAAKNTVGKPNNNSPKFLAYLIEIKGFGMR